MHLRPRATTAWIGAVVLVALLIGCGSHRNAPHAVNGELDLSSWSAARDGSVNLDGAWHIYWGALLTPMELTREGAPAPTGSLAVPGGFVGIVGRTELAGTGFATLRLVVVGLGDEQNVALRLAGVSSAYRLWSNGALVARSGRVGASRETTEPFEVTQVVRVAPRHGRLELVLQVASFEGGQSGVYKPVVLGDADELERHQARLGAIDTALLGALLLLAVYHLGLFLLRRKERAALYVAAICFFWGIRIPLAGMSGRVWWSLAQSLSWSVACVVESVALYFAVASILPLVAHLYPRWRSDAVAKGSLVAATLAAIATILIPTPILAVASAWALIAGALLVYSVAISVRELFHDHRPATIFATLGFLVLAAAGVHDMLLDIGAIDAEFLMPLGVLGFVLLQSIGVASRLYKLLSSTEALSAELEATNRELKRNDALKDEFLTTTSHELRTPLHGMIGIADSLTKGAAGSLPRLAQDNLALIAASGHRLSRLVSDILDLARLKHDDIRLNLGPVRFGDVARTVVDLLAPLVQGKAISVECAVPDDLPLVRADEDRLQQVLYNLLGNAIKFTERGTIRIEAERCEDKVRVTVSDTGRGIPEQQLEAVFRPYQKLEPTAGSGLGLAISRQLVALHGGELRAESKAGEGSRFLFTVPIAREDDAAARTTGERDQLASPVADLAKPPTESVGRVLVVDDEAVNLQVVLNHLSLHGIEVLTASSGEQALRNLRVAEELPDVVLLDVMMPGMDGLRTCEAIRMRWSMLELPVLLLTALNRNEDIVRGFESGANDHVSKPFHADVLLTRVRGLISVKRRVSAELENLRLESELDRTRVRELESRLQAERASLESLRYQLNPHFLLNAMATIRGAISHDPNTARRAVSALADFCRLTLQHGPRELVTVQDELDMVRAFLDVHQSRFGDELEVVLEVDEAVVDAVLPAWLLQPLVENAVKHGRRSSEPPLVVRIRGYERNDGALVFRVSNTGELITRTEQNPPCGGVGLNNLKERIKRWYPEEHAFTLHGEDGWVHAELVVHDLHEREVSGVESAARGTTDTRVVA